METLQDKITSIRGDITANEAAIVTAKETYLEVQKDMLAKNRELNKVIKKLEETEATLASIFGTPAPAPVEEALDTAPWNETTEPATNEE